MIIALYYVLYYMLCNVFTINSDSMLNFLSIIPLISVMHFALLFLQLVFSFACVFLQFLYLLSVLRWQKTDRRNTRVHKYKEIIERHLRSFIRHFCLTLLKINMIYLAASFQRRCVV